MSVSTLFYDHFTISIIVIFAIAIIIVIITLLIIDYKYLHVIFRNNDELSDKAISEEDLDDNQQTNRRNSRFSISSNPYINRFKDNKSNNRNQRNSLNRSFNDNNNNNYMYRSNSLYNKRNNPLKSYTKSNSISNLTKYNLTKLNKSISLNQNMIRHNNSQHLNNNNDIEDDMIEPSEIDDEISLDIYEDDNNYESNHSSELSNSNHRRSSIGSKDSKQSNRFSNSKTNHKVIINDVTHISNHIDKNINANNYSNVAIDESVQSDYTMNKGLEQPTTKINSTDQSLGPGQLTRTLSKNSPYYRSNDLNKSQTFIINKQINNDMNKKHIEQLKNQSKNKSQSDISIELNILKKFDIPHPNSDLLITRENVISLRNYYQQLATSYQRIDRSLELLNGIIDIRDKAFGNDKQLDSQNDFEIDHSHGHDDETFEDMIESHWIHIYRDILKTELSK